MAVSFPQKYSNSENVKFFERQFAVCRVVLADGRGGTGFLIGKNLIMTNNHVIPNEATALKAKAIFFYTTGAQGIEVNLDPHSFFCTSLTPDQLGFKPITAKNLDFTIVSIQSHPKIAEITHLAFCIFDSQRPKKGSHANIIHHPLDPDGTCYQKISFRDNTIGEVELHTLHYTTFTMPGSSGSPVMDDQGNLFALHRATCTEILSALLKVLNALLKELFPSAVFTEQKDSMRAIIDGSPLCIFFKGELRGKYHHEGKMPSPASLLMLLPKPAKEWALQFLKQQEITLSDHHKNCNTAVPMHAICTYLQNNSHLDFIKAQYAASQKNLNTLLKENCLKNLSSLPLFLTNEAFPIKEFFTRLSIIPQVFQEKREDQAKEDVQVINQDSLRERHSLLSKPEESIGIDTIFNHQAVKRVLVLGKAGVGKSTLCQKIVCDWASGNFFAEKFIVAYYLTLRDLNEWIETHSLGHMQHPDEWLSSVIAYLCYQDAHQKEIFHNIQKNSEKILIVFDGWDEASPNLVKAIERFFRDTTIQHYLLTSRPGVTNRIQDNFDMIVENTGFTYEQVKNYIKKFFTYTKTQDVELFLNTLRSRSDLLTLCHVPIQLQILCSLWRKGVQTFPRNLTSMFFKITEHLFLWSQRKQIEHIPRSRQELFYTALGEIALRGLKIQQLIISKRNIQVVLENKRFDDVDIKDLINTGLIRGCGQDDIYFIHLMYQEYCIARYISYCPPQQQSKFVQTHRYLPQFHLVMRMLAGHLWENSEERLKIKILEDFFQWIYDGNIDLISSYQTELVLSCLEECGDEELEKKIWDKYKIQNFIEYVLSTETMLDCLGRLTMASKRVFARAVEVFQTIGTYKQIKWFLKNLHNTVKEEHLSDNFWAFISELLDRHSSIRQTTAEAIGKMAEHLGETSIKQILACLEKALQGKNSEICKSVAKALASVANHIQEKNITQFLKCLEITLEDENASQHNFAAYAFGELVRHTDKKNIPQILNWLKGMLGNEDHHPPVNIKNVPKAGKTAQQDVAAASTEKSIYMRRVATAVFAEMAGKWGEEDSIFILKALEKALVNKYAHVRMGAIAALEKMIGKGGQEGTTVILRCIEKVIVDENFPVRSAAAALLGVMTEQADEKNIVQLVDWLERMVTNKNSFVRGIAVENFGKITKSLDKKMIARILNRLEKMLKDNDSFVLGALAVALGQIAGQIGTENVDLVLRCLEKALTHKNFVVRGAAAKTLGEIAPRTDPKKIADILKWLNRILSDKDHFVRGAVVEAMGKMTGQVKEEHSNLIFKCLDKMLVDKDPSMRCTTVRVLGQIAKQASCKDLTFILNWLKKMLNDSDYFVRRAAVNVLGDIAEQITEKEITVILNHLEQSIADKDASVRQAAVIALGKAVERVEKPNIVQILNLLVKTMVDKDPIASAATTEVLNKIAIQLNETDIALFLNWLKQAFVTSNLHSAATKIFSNIQFNEKNISQVLTWLEKLLTDKNLYVREAVAEPLVTLSKQVNSSNMVTILSCLEKIFAYHQPNLYQIGAQVLSEIITRLGEADVIQVLLWIEKTHADEHLVIRLAVTEALGTVAQQLGEKVWLLSWLEKRMVDQDPSARHSTIKVLGEIVHLISKQILPKVLKWLEKTVIDKDPSVRCSTIEVLGKMVHRIDKQSVSNVINWLEKMIVDENCSERGLASEVLVKMVEQIEEGNISQLLSCLERIFTVETVSTASLDKLISLNENVTFILTRLANSLIDKKPETSFLIAWGLFQKTGEANETTMAIIPRYLNKAIKEISKDNVAEEKSLMITLTNGIPFLLPVISTQQMLTMLTFNDLPKPFSSIFFQLLLNQSIPLCIVKNQNNYSIQYGTTLCRTINQTQINVLIQSVNEERKNIGLLPIHNIKENCVIS